MKRSLVIAVGIVCLAGAGLRGQTTYPYIGELKQNYGFVKTNLLRLAEKMPEEHYSFKPTPDVRSFGESIAHVSDSQARSCSLVNGVSKTVDAESKKTKTNLLAALKDSFAICDTAFDALTDAGASQMVKLGQSKFERSKLGLLAGVIGHSNEQYGYMAVYLRLKGIVPPSTEAMNQSR
jgi:DinB superfamily